MKKILTIALLLIALTSQAQISDELTQDTIDLWIVPGCTKCITAAKMLSILTHINDNKLHKDSLNLYASPLADTSLWDRNESSGQMWNKNLTDDVGIGTASPATALDVVGTTTTDELDMQSPLVWMDGFRKQPYYYSDFLATAAGIPWVGAAVGTGGTVSGYSVPTSEHPGLLRLLKGTGTNAGYSYLFYNQSIVGVVGNEISNCILNWPITDSITTRFGWHDATTVTAPVDGVYFEMVGTSGGANTVVGKTSNGSNRSTTGTSYAIKANTWYRLKIVVNSNATRVDYYIYNDAGTVLWNDYLTTNIPTSSGTSHGLIVTKQTASALANILYLDYMDIYLGSLLR